MFYKYRFKFIYTRDIDLIYLCSNHKSVDSDIRYTLPDDTHPGVMYRPCSLATRYIGAINWYDMLYIDWCSVINSGLAWFIVAWLV